jgi:hypothetical protein
VGAISYGCSCKPQYPTEEGEDTAHLFNRLCAMFKLNYLTLTVEETSSAFFVSGSAVCTT